MAYASVTVEGGLFPADLLDRIAAGQAEGQRAADFHVNGARRLADEIQSAFSDGRSFWDAFQGRLRRSRESKTTITREAWMAGFFELLGFDQLVLQRASAEVGGQLYFMSHRAGDDPDAPPVHIVAIDQELDRRNGARRSPHALVQEYLNRSDALWGLVTNGRRLRLLRDSARLSKPTYLEFDLEGMIDGNLYSEFVLLYRLVHASRFPRDGASAHECLLERYYQQGIDEGGRVRDKLRDGVEEALKALGTAFLAHPESGALREKFERGQIDAPKYYRQLLRLVYRFLFLMVAEERRLIFPPDDTDTTRQAVYSKYYSVARLRDRAERYFASDRNGDLWLGLRETFRLFRDNDAAKQLGLRALDGELFGPDACADLEGAGCSNEQLLTAIRCLSTFVDEDTGRRRSRSRGQRRRVNYGALDVEEFGSVYESLLDFRPQVTLDPSGFDLVAGGERKQTGSYYTPPELVRELIESALVPVMEERLAQVKSKDEKEAALLGLRVCDPASGSGHFLLAAARRIARELAKVKSEEEEPPPKAYREAVRDVIRHCIYAVDKNPLAVDLCKVALWIEGHNAGLPLSFLDQHVKCGDSLVGVADLAVLEQGIPDDAYKAVTGDDKAAVTHYRKRNKQEREGQLRMEFKAASPEDREAMAREFHALAAQDERTPDDVHAKEELYESLRRQGSEWWELKVACDLWTAAFFTPLALRQDDQPDVVPTTDTVRRYLTQPNAAYGPLVAQAMALSQGHPFFHWPLEFPDVFAAGGFDAVLSNPPFMGGHRVSLVFGRLYFNYITTVYSPAGGKADFCTYFYRRAYNLLCPGGHLGMVATNTIAQGDTRERGLAIIVKQGGAITFAHRFIKWPGAASVEVNLVAVRKARWAKECTLDGQRVSAISSRLDTEPEAEPARLRANRHKAFRGINPRSTGFIVSRDEADQLLAASPRNRECLFPFLSGDDLNSHPGQEPGRWIINFFDWPLARVQQYPDLLRIVEERVKPERDDLKDGVPGHQRLKEQWWQYEYRAEGLDTAVARCSRALTRSRVGELHTLALVPTGCVYTTIVFPFDDYYHFALLQSNIHEAWVRRTASTVRTDIQYNPTDSFETFSFPQELAPEDQEWAARLGSEYHERRRQAMLARNLGLTKTYNLFHSPECQDEDIVRLRELHAEMDRAILACYGWQDLDAGHGFYQNERGQTRYTVSPEARREILRRLLELNLAIASEEAQQPTPVGARRRRRKAE